MSELKPCPFCGNEKIDKGLMVGNMTGWSFCQCEECLAEIHVKSISVDDVIEAWNRRAESEDEE